MHAEKEKLLNEAYQQFLQFGLGNLPLEMYDTIVADNYMGYGTALDEKLFSAIGFRDLVMRQMEQGKGMEMKFAETPVFRRISVSEDVAIIVAEILISIQVESSRHDLFVRMTTVMEFLNGKWIAVHSHGSRPDATMGETDTWHINEWKRKNEELQKLVDEKTADLAGKNQELVIEACLERVRSQALSMKVPEDMPEVCRIIAEQLILLGVKDIRNIQTAIFYPEKGTYLNFEYYCLYDKKLISEINFKRPEQESFANKMMNEPGAFLEEHFSGKELIDFLAYQEKTNQFVDLHLYKTESVSYYFYSLGPVSLGISTYAYLKPGDLDLMKRLSNVFELAYTRFLDIQQAEAQTKEAQIELALERVRSRAMAMQHSEELADLVSVVFKELTGLEFPLTSCIIWISNKELLTEELWVANSEMNKPPQAYYFKPFHHPFFRSILHAWKEGDRKWIYELIGQEKLDFEEHFFSEVGSMPQVLKTTLQTPDKVVFSASFSSFGALEVVGNEHISDEKFEILHRFGKVFDLSYTRFNDIRKAEAQAREARIELALERVRARTMAMQRSEELQEAANLLFMQVHDLDIPAWSCGYNIWEKNEKEFTGWMSTRGSIQPSFKIPVNENPSFVRQYESRVKGEPFYTEEISGQDLADHYSYMQTLPDFKPILDGFLKSGYVLPESQVNNVVNFSHGNLIFITSEPVPEAWDIFKRFAKVFEQTYTRFLDLLKAETQARDAEIELALERVRARTMAMQKSNELPEAANLLFQQMQTLGMPAWSAGYCIWDEDKQGVTLWMSSEGVIQPPFHAPLNEDPTFVHMLESYEKGENFHVEAVGGDELVSHYKYMRTLPVVGRILDSIIDAGHPLPVFQIMHCAYFSQGFLLFITNEPVPQAWDIFKRFSNVFDQTYTRFLDLQKAEGQAREAQIETALERVRSHSLAMHHSEELEQVVGSLFDQLVELGLLFDGASIFLFDKGNRNIHLWVASKISTPLKVAMPYDEYIMDNPIIKDLWNANEAGKDIINKTYSGRVKDEYTHYVGKYNESIIPEWIKNMMLEAKSWTVSYAVEKNSLICIDSWTGQFITEENFRIVKRFAKVFEQAYTRFLDLQKAEAQAREAQIESALEKVRSRTMAMQKSDELADAAYVLFQQLNHLGVIHERINIGIVKEETNSIDFWITEQGGNQINTRFSASLHEPTTISKIHAAWKAGQKSMIVDLTGEELKAWLKYLTEVIGIPFDQAFMHNRRVQTAGFFSKGMLVLTTPEPVPEESVHLLEKFAGVFDLTYTRFNDLLLAEAQTHKANIEVALERVRARALAMQEPEELIEVAQVLRHEMGLLGVEELETSSIYLHDENQDIVACWYAIADLRHPEKKLVADQITIDLKKTWVGRQMFDFYQSDKTQISILMQGANRIEWINYCASVSTVLGDFYGESIPDRTYHLYKFSNGAIGAASAGDISTESWELLSRTASVFSLAYSRFKDLTKARIDLQRLKEEKQRAELALTELKATQAQLVQAEKMASLGELTAGIAHEIQNPLNFVNNFSELSNELIEEMQEEMVKGNSDEVKNIVADIRNNLEKINLHGKRADAIVKGMLQHSRTTSGEKQPTDINALAEEYLRLAYHGLRAKDKNFNATLKTAFDDSIGSINIIPQDIGRVLLNLINNAFYAVSEKQKLAIKGYEPAVIVRTKKINDIVQIEVRDNGIGIPENISGKIFQPFFTTKPTGQGTGLGLSLAYDIVTKGHNGEMGVISNNTGETIFYISLPI